MNQIITFLIAICFCYTSYAQNKLGSESRFIKIQIDENTPCSAREPNKDILINGNPQFKSWTFDSISMGMKKKRATV